uniref:Uncharacterized protein n=1 Tax=Vitis vinifera TaxID=29760 RepID=A5B7L2_VITVI|nr:hypothetical protein VITISV_011910 [Vitis vinifera]
MGLQDFQQLQHVLQHLEFKVWEHPNLKEFMAGVSRRLDQIESSYQDHQLVDMGTDEIDPHEARVERLESKMRQIRLQNEDLTWDDRDGISTTSLPAKFHMIDIEHYSGIGCLKIHLRLYTTIMRGHGLDDARVEKAIARELWIDTTPTFDNKGKKLVGSPERAGEVSTISYQHQGPTRHSHYRPLIVRAHFPYLQHQYQPVYAQQPYIAQTSMQPQLPYLKATTPLRPRAYAQRPMRQFTPLGITLTKVFENLKYASLIVPLAARPLPHTIPPHFRLHEHCLYHQTQRHDTKCCVTLHHVIQDLIDSGMINLSRPSNRMNMQEVKKMHAMSVSFEQCMSSNGLVEKMVDELW